MGSGSISKTTIKKNELLEMSKMTLFNPDIILTFFSFFQKFSSKIKDDGVIDYNEFLSIVKLHDNSFSKHLFYTFDQNRDNCINFREFLKFFSVFENGKSISQCELCFKLFSNPQTNKIEKETLLNIINDAISSHEILKSYLTQKDIENIVNHTLEKYKNVISQTNIINNSTLGNLLNISSCEKNVQIENNNTLNIKTIQKPRLTVTSSNNNWIFLIIILITIIAEVEVLTVINYLSEKMIYIDNIDEIINVCIKNEELLQTLNFLVS